MILTWSYLFYTACRARVTVGGDIWVPAIQETLCTPVPDVIFNMEKKVQEAESDFPQYRQQLYAEEMFGSAALVVIGEPTSEEHKNAILERISQGKV